MPQVALSWCLQQDPVKCVIVGASSPEQVERNVQTVTLQQVLYINIVAVSFNWPMNYLFVKGQLEHVMAIPVKKSGGRSVVFVASPSPPGHFRFFATLLFIF